MKPGHEESRHWGNLTEPITHSLRMVSHRILLGPSNCRPKYDFSTTVIDSNENNNGLQSYCRHERKIMKLKFSGMLKNGYGHKRQLASFNSKHSSGLKRNVGLKKRLLLRRNIGLKKRLMLTSIAWLLNRPAVKRSNA
ncbi:hypothetical protein BFW01_g1443 [Lasiodiplodia theobromae]|uniref:Uncharacterized protein n=1 Tax=Lasiodiplodia theobromae TaxID=45133 RepID=A0A8H7IT09_9PEZI|nr:hypothetical protein BFW01_g1443 [Lasiodiplodia theobromae]